MDPAARVERRDGAGELARDPDARVERRVSCGEPGERLRHQNTTASEPAADSRA